MNFIKLIRPEILKDSDSLDKYSRIYQDNKITKIEFFNIEIMNNDLIIEVTNDNEDYLKKFEYLFDKPTKEEVINYLIIYDRFEECIKIQNGCEFTKIKTMEERINDGILDIREKLK
jgi:hypothetical protein